MFSKIKYIMCYRYIAFYIYNIYYISLKKNKNLKLKCYLNLLLNTCPLHFVKFYYLLFYTGVNFMLRKVGNSTKPLVTMSTEDGKVFNFLSESTFKNVKLQFTLGVEYSDTTPDGRKTKVLVFCVKDLGAFCKTKHNVHRFKLNLHRLKIMIVESLPSCWGAIVFEKWVKQCHKNTFFT